MLFFVLFLQYFSLSFSQRDCWSGTSTSSGGEYPPSVVSCSQTGLVCQRSKVTILNYYSMKCSTNEFCQRDLLDANSGSAIYSEVICCDSGLCNGYPGQPSGPSPTPMPQPSDATKIGNYFFSILPSLLIFALPSLFVLFIRA